MDACKHFTLTELAEGVFAAVHKEGGAAYSNAGIVDLGSRTLIFDTFDMPIAATELRLAAEQLTGRSAGWVVVSHKHGDHWGGNQVFAGEAHILSTHQTRQGMLPLVREIEALAADPSPVAAEIRSLEAQLGQETDPNRRFSLEHALQRNRYTLEALPAFQACLPEQSFDGRLLFHGTKRTVELVSARPAHTPSDCYLALHAEKIVFAGDIAFFDCPPFLALDCNIPGWLEELEGFKASGFKTFVPGHGPLGKKADIEKERQFILALQAVVAQAVQAGNSLEQVLKLHLPEPFHAWGKFIFRNENNFRTLFTQMSGQSG